MRISIEILMGHLVAKDSKVFSIVHPQYLYSLTFNVFTVESPNLQRVLEDYFGASYLIEP